MKNRFSTLFIIVIILLNITCCAYAERENNMIIDFSSFSNEELLLIRAQLNNEIVNRKIAKKAIIPPGTYIIGVDIPEGTYIVTGERAVVMLYESTESLGKGSLRFEYFDLKESESFSVLSGQVIIIKDNSVEFEVYSGIVFE